MVLSKEVGVCNVEDGVCTKSSYPPFPGFVLNTNKTLLIEEERYIRKKQKEKLQGLKNNKDEYNKYRSSISSGGTIEELYEPSKKDIMRQIRSFATEGLEWHCLLDVRDPPSSRQKPDGAVIEFANHGLVKNRIFVLSPSAKGQKGEVSSDDEEIWQSITVANVRTHKLPKRDEGEIELNVVKVNLDSVSFYWDDFIEQGGAKGDEFDDREELCEFFAEALFDQDQQLVESIRKDLEQPSDELVLEKLKAHINRAIKRTLTEDKKEVLAWANDLRSGYDVAKLDGLRSAKILPQNAVAFFQKSSEDEVLESEVRGIPTMKAYGPATYLLDGVSTAFDGSNIVVDVGGEHA